MGPEDLSGDTSAWVWGLGKIDIDLDRASFCNQAKKEPEPWGKRTKSYQGKSLL